MEPDRSLGLYRYNPVPPPGVFGYPIVYWQYWECCCTKEKKHKKKKKENLYQPGMTEVLNIIECHNPEVFKAITQCGMPYLTARKLVKKMIDSILDYYDG